MGATYSNAKEGRKRRNGLKAHTGDWQGFVDLALSDAHREDLDELYGRGAFDGLQFIAGVVADGYKVSLSPDKLHHCVVATLTGRDADCPNVGYSLSARGPDATGALLVLWYKHERLAGGGSWGDAGAVENQQLPLWG